MEISSATANTMTTLVHMGFAITNFYGDGAVRMSNGTVATFVHEDGTVTRPQTTECYVVQAQMHEVGLKFAEPPRKEKLSQFLGYSDQRAAGEGDPDPSIWG